MFVGRPVDGSDVRTCSCGRMFGRRATGDHVESLYRKQFKGQIQAAAAGYAHGCVPRRYHRNRVTGRRERRSGLWPLLETRPLRQQHRPLRCDLRGGVRDLALRSLHPPAYRDTGLVNGIRIARNKRMPPIEIAALRHQPVPATWRQPVQRADICRRESDAIRNQLPIGSNNPYRYKVPHPAVCRKHG